MRDIPRLPTAPGFWRSPVRGLRFTSVLGVVLLVGITALFVTGLLSYAAYNPGLAPVNDKTPDKGLLGFYLFSWPTDPHWLYRLTQGVHVTLGITLIPVLLAKLWSVVPRLFALPPVRSVAHGLERVSLLLLVGGGLFEFVTGVLNVQLDYLFPGSFYPLHFYGAWVFFAAFLAHAALKLPVALRNLRAMRSGGTGGEGDEGGGEAELRAPAPDPPTFSRRGALWFVGGGSALLFATTAGRSFDALRPTALLAPHGGADPGSGPNGFQVNKTAAYAGVRTADTGAETWRLTVTGRTGTVRLDRGELEELGLHSAELPIACVEGWSTSDQQWRGVRLGDLAALVGHGGDPPDVFVESLQRHGAFRHAALSAHQVADPRSLLALYVNGARLSPDHGYPARIIVPAAPGVLNTKWVSRLTFGKL